MADGALVECHERKIVFPDGFLQSAGQAVAHSSRFFTGIGFLDLTQCEVARAAGDGCCSHRTAAKRLVHLFSGSIQTGTEIRHAVLVTAHAAGAGISSGDDLAEYRQIRIDPEIALGAGNTDTEARNNLIKYQQCAILVSQFLHALDKLLGNRTGTGFRTNRLQEYRGCTAVQPVLSQLPLQVFQIIGEKLIGVLEHKVGNTAGLDPLGSGNADTVCQLV